MSNTTLKKILVLNREYYPVIGGGGRATQILAEEWARYGYQVDLITTRIGDTAKNENVNGVNVFRVSSFSRSELMTLWGAFGYIVSAFIKGAVLFRRNRYGAIHSGFLVPAGIIGVLLSKLYRVPHETMPMGGDVYEPTKRLSPHRNFIFRAIVRWVVNRSIVASSSKDLETKIKRHYSKQFNSYIIPVPFPEPRGIILNWNKKPVDAAPSIVAVGVLLRRKNYDSIIRALALLQRKDVRLCIIGEGPLRQELEQLAERLGVADRVFMPGALSEQEKFDRIMDATIFCSMADHDGYSIVCQEGMYCGRPIVAADTGGQVDYLVHERNALLVDAHDPAEIASAFSRFLDNPALARRLADQTKSDSEQFFSDKIAKRHIELMSINQ